MERELGVDAALAALTETELRRVMAARGIGPPVESPLAGAVRVEPAQTAAAPPPRQSRPRRASARAREASEASEEPPAPKRKYSADAPYAARSARQRACKKAKLDEFNDLERRVAALADRVAELEEELRRRSGDDSLDDDDAQSPRVADAL